jgi:ABC-type transport system substrate-binding protein
MRLRGSTARRVQLPLMALVLLVASCSNGADADTTTTTDPDTTTTAAPTTVVTTTVPEETTTTTTQPLVIESPEDALVAFLALMRDGRYEEAERLYGGTYEILIGWNEPVDPSDQVALLEASCTYQLRCELLIRRIEVDETAPAGVFGFLVEFEWPDGELVTLESYDGTIKTQWRFQVIEEGDGYPVLDLPLYLG